ncbi:methyltransferase domain-containing protein [Rhizobium cremeum]|uniref:class I SAM-dependent methyltransferase n=1 Tax=Rhizobium cremeum TaxID=2813827 RepID=UPI000DE4C4D7
MTDADKVFAGSIPALYERFMVPMIFAPYAEAIAEKVAARHPATVLELAAGTGAVTRAMAERLPETAALTATDLNQPMIDLAMTLQETGNVLWRQADAMALPFADQSFDTAVCQFGVMFFPDKVASYREVRRVLKPRGAYLLAVWDRIENNEFVSVVSEVLSQRFADNPPQFMRRIPHGYHDLALIDGQLRAAGFSTVEAETLKLTGRSRSPLDAATGYCQANPLRNELEERAPGGLEAVTELVAEALEKHFGPGPIEGVLSAHVITARG